MKSIARIFVPLIIDKGSEASLPPSRAHRQRRATLSRIAADAAAPKDGGAECRIIVPSSSARPHQH
jgi:hypothetical protein